MGGAVRRVTLSFLPARRELVVRVLLGDFSIYLGPLCLRRDAVPFQFGHRRVASPFRLGHFCPHRVGPSLVLLAPGNIPAEILALGKVHPCQHGGEIWFTCHPLENWVTCHSFDGNFDPGGAHDMWRTRLRVRRVVEEPAQARVIVLFLLRARRVDGFGRRLYRVPKLTAPPVLARVLNPRHVRGGSLKQNCAAGASRTDNSLIARLEAFETNDSRPQAATAIAAIALCCSCLETRATKQVLPGRHRRRADTGQWKLLHTHDERDYACFGSGGSSATTTEARDASRTTLSAPSPSSGSSSAFA